MPSRRPFLLRAEPGLQPADGAVGCVGVVVAQGQVAGAVAAAMPLTLCDVLQVVRRLPSYLEMDARNRRHGKPWEVAVG